MKIIWHADDMGEARWFRHALGDLITDEVVDLDMRITDASDAVHVINSNYTPLRSLDRYFAQCRRDSTNITLLQGSDEWFSGSYTVYRHFDRVIRTYESWLLNDAGILTIPLGFPFYVQPPAMIRPAAARAYIWSFVGGIKNSRHAMAEAMKTISPSRLVDNQHGRPLSDQDYRDLVGNSVFIPCPMGNSTGDTWRLYEALEYGCIPLIERRASLDYFRRLFGDHPIPTFASWNKASAYVGRIASDPAALNALQDRVTTWWSNKKLAVRAGVAKFVQGTSHHHSLQAFAGRFRIRTPAAHEALRLLELTRHQNVTSLYHRIQTPRRIMDRIRGETATSG